MQVWIAILGVLFSLLAPGINHSMAAPAGVPGMADICSAVGNKPAPVSQDGSPASVTHCSYCLAHCTTPGLLPGVLPIAPPAASAAPVARRYQAPHLLFPWTVARSRAPPVLV